MKYPTAKFGDACEESKKQSLAVDRLDFLFATSTLPCPYLPARQERKVVANLAGSSAGREYERLIRAGYRRSRTIAYRPACPACRSCVPVRVPVAGFTPSKSLRRVRRTNADLTVRVLPPLARADHFHLFRLYQEVRHGAGEMADMDFEAYRALVEESFVSTWLAEFRDRDGGLMAVCLYDVLEDALSAVYTFYDPMEAKRSLGNHMILWLAEHCRETKKSHLYLGYWIKDCAKMAYKARFRPLEMLDGRQWRRMP